MPKLQKTVDSCMAFSVCTHFALCGLPVILALLGSAGTFIPVPYSVMTIILIVSGALLGTSIGLEIFTCRCDRKKWRIVLIAFCTLLYAIGLCGHLGVFSSHATPNGDATVVQCH